MKRAASIVLAALVGGATGFFVWHFVVPRPEPALPEPPPVAAARAPDDESAPLRRIPLGSPVPHAATEKPALVEGQVDKRWADKNRDAIRALDAGDIEGAVKLFEECLQAVPEEKIFATNLAEALARLSSRDLEKGDKDAQQRAHERLTRAKTLAPQREDIARRLDQLERLSRSEKGLWTDTSEHFELSYDGERSELLWGSWQITAVLETAYQDLGERFGRWPVEDGRPRIRVVLYRRDGFHDATGIGHWAGGLYDGTVRVPLEDLGRDKSDLERVLRHEITHAFVADSGGRDVPGWLNEGLAQWLEQRDLDRHQKQIEAARAQLAGKEFLKLVDLKKSLASLPEDKIPIAYVQSLLLVDAIEHAHGERVLYEMVAGCKRGESCESTFLKRTRVALDQVLDDLRRTFE